MMKEIKLIHLEETNSTNSYIRSLVGQEEITEPLVVFTDYQTSGQGQAGNYWESERSQNLLFSLLFFPQQLLAESFFRLSQIVSLSIKEALSKHTEEIVIKWPNDIYWRDQKICGILIENDISGSHIVRSIIGVGINLNQTVFESDAPNPVSLKHIIGESTEPISILSDVLNAFNRLYIRFLQGEEKTLAEEYHLSLYRGNGYYPYVDKEGTFEARIVKVEPLGFLHLEERDGTLRKYAFKEVKYI